MSTLDEDNATTPRQVRRIGTVIGRVRADRRRAGESRAHDPSPRDMNANAAPWAVIVLVVDDQTVPIGVIGPGSPCDLGMVDQLLRLSLAARRHGMSIRLSAVHQDLRDLVELVGVAEQLGMDRVGLT
jgi:hypothetical protein